MYLPKYSNINCSFKIGKSHVPIQSQSQAKLELGKLANMLLNEIRSFKSKFIKSHVHILEH